MKTICVTGASSGIGKEFALLLAREKCHLILVARRKELLVTLKEEIESSTSSQVTIIVADLSKQNHVHSLVKSLLESDIDILINNAGFGEFASFESAKHVEDMIAVNVMSLTLLSRGVVPHLIKKNSGGILNVASIAGFLPGPKMAVYFATKSYVLSFSQALSAELSRTGVTCTVLCPGPTKSEFFSVSKASSLENSSAPTSAEVAAYGWRSFERGKVVAVHGFKNKLSVFSLRFFPRWFIIWVVRRMM